MTTGPTSGPSLALSGSPADASSLRAAALKTLKLGKRRRPTIGQAQFSRPVPQDTVQLDYGQDDNAMESTPPPPTPVVSKDVGIAKPSSPEPDTNDVEMREEGEISDEDPLPIEVKPTLQSRLEPPKGPAAFRNGYDSVKPPSPKQSGSTVPALLSRLSMSSPPVPSASDIPTSPSLQARISERSRRSLPENSHVKASIPTSVSYTPPHDRSPYYPLDRSVSPNAHFASGPTSTSLSSAVDSGHVRPGVAMTQDEYDKAKDIILDLLGWGVPPEYLLESGLTRQLIYYVFTELNLKLPSNFDATGIQPYGPTLLPSSSSEIQGLERTTVQLASRINEIGQGSSLASAGTDQGTSSPFSMAQSRFSEDLHDMERQRRQELLARKKAVLASRKTRQRTPPNNDQTSVQHQAFTDSDVSMEAPALTETVESFLKSIGSATHVETVETQPSSQVKPMEGMESEDIPGLSHAKANVVTSPPLVSPTQSIAPPPPSASDSVTDSLTKVHIEESSAANGVPPHPPRRRGTRRPVASDFVDVDDQRSSTPKSDPPQGLLQRRTNSSMSFANISNMRRCIIDLSDSEDEEKTDGSAKRIQTTFLVAGNSTQPQTSRSSPVPLSAVKARSATVTPSPDALELQIRKMREEIAQREQNRLRKLALAKLNTTTPSINDTSPPTVNSSSIIKDQEQPNPQVFDQDSSLSYSDLSNQSTPDTPYMTAIGSETSWIVDTSVLLTTFTRRTGNPSLNESLTVSTDSMKPEDQTQTVELVDAAVNPIESNEEDTPMHITVDADLNSPLSAQISYSSETLLSEPQTSLQSPPPQESHENFHHYESHFSNYPLLRAQLTPPRPQTSDSIFSHTPSEFSGDILSHQGDVNKALDYLYSQSQSPALPDLQSLKLATAMKQLDPSKQLCQYEFPGGGVCRDGGCEDVHLNRLLSGAGDGVTVEPSDQDTANYVLGAMPAEWRAKNNLTVSKVLSALQLVRRSTSFKALSFEDRVTRALYALGAAPPIPQTS